jgi:hypothetical protein
VNYAWQRSFAMVKSNAKAILEQGWYPANRALLTHPDVVRTKKLRQIAATILPLLMFQQLPQQWTAVY